MKQRLGTKSRFLFMKEQVWGEDTGITEAFVVPLSGVESFVTDQPQTPADIYIGTRDPRGSVLGMIGATGNIPLAMEFLFAGYPIDTFFGHDVYSRVGGRHRWIGAGEPGSFQGEKQFLQTPIIKHRNPGIRSSQLQLTQAMSGQAAYTLIGLGKGTEFRTSVQTAAVTGTAAETFAVIVATSDALGVKVDGGTTQVAALTPGGARTAAQVAADINALPLVGAVASDDGAGHVVITSTAGGTIQIDSTTTNSAHTLLGLATTLTALGDIVPQFLGYEPVNYFNGAILMDGVSLGTVTAFTLNLSNAMVRQDAAFQGGLAAGVNAGLLEATGNLGIIFTTDQGDAFYDAAINQLDVRLECMWANKPMALGPTRWLRYILPAIRFSRKTVGAGGAPGQLQDQTYRAQVGGADEAAELFGGLVGPFVIGAGTTDKFAIKINGAAPIVVTLTAGAARTAAQVAGEINTALGVNGSADDFNGRVRIKSALKGTAGSVQIDTTQATNADAVLGLDGTTWTGVNATPIIAELYNDRLKNY